MQTVRNVKPQYDWTKTCQFKTSDGLEKFVAHINPQRIYPTLFLAALECTSACNRFRIKIRNMEHRASVFSGTHGNPTYSIRVFNICISKTNNVQPQNAKTLPCSE